MPRIVAERIAEELREISIAEFFEKNRHLLGYENPTRSLITVVKELVDNSIEACLEAKVLPTIKVKVKPISINRYRVRVEDNGPGLPPNKVPIAFGKFLVGSRFHRIKQAVGVQGIGAKGAILYAQLTTGKPTKITTFQDGRAHELELMIDVLKNRPLVLSRRAKEASKPHGLTMEMEVEGRYVKGLQSIPTYLRRIALANPYTKLVFDGPDGKLVLGRATNKLPAPAREIKPHPYGVELGKLKRMLKYTPYKSMLSFLTNEFCRIGKNAAKRVCKLARVAQLKNPRELGHQDVERLHKAMQTVKLRAPPTNCLSPLNEEMLLAALKKDFQAEFYAATVRDPSVYRGYPFQVQVALAYGENLPFNQALLMRFANHTPLLYHQSECAITKAAQQVNWRNYGLSQSEGCLPSAPLVILVDFISVWIPYTSEGKQAIANYPEISREIRLALQESGRSLARFVRRKRKLEMLMMRAGLFESYAIPLSEYLGKLTDREPQSIKERIDELIRGG